MESSAARDVLINESGLRRTFEALRAIDIALVSAGDATDHSLLVRYGLPEGVTARALREAGAVGDLIGRYLDRDGQPIDHPLNRQVMSPEIEDFRNIPIRIVTSGGRHRQAILRAITAAGHVNVVITDAECARLLLGDEEPIGQV
jgi:DNA-binding transcriptional regulator LsrR (DeoR family)